MYFIKIAILNSGIIYLKNFYNICRSKRDNPLFKGFFFGGGGEGGENGGVEGQRKGGRIFQAWGREPEWGEGRRKKREFFLEEGGREEGGTTRRAKFFFGGRREHRG